MRYSLIIIFAVALFFGSCGNTGENIPKVSNIKVTLETRQFDKDLYALDTNHIGAGLQQLLVKYPDFLNYFLDTVMAYGIRGNYNDTVKGIREGLKPFLTYKDFVALEDTIKAHYPDTKTVDAELTDGFRFIKYYLPDYSVPRVIYLNMGLSNWPTFALDKTTVCVGQDMFLGEQFPYYRSIGVPNYMAPHLRRSYIPVSLFSVIYKSMHPYVSDDKTMLDLMIQRGKEQYFLHKILPHKPDSVLFGFTQIQVEGCAKDEARIYNFFIHENLLYNKQTHDIQPFVNDGPFAKGLEDPTDSVKTLPGNVGGWLGYRIVCAYMSQHPKKTLAELLQDPIDAPRFLDEARYKPK
jgi:hypothetical protein